MRAPLGTSRPALNIGLLIATFDLLLLKRHGMTLSTVRIWSHVLRLATTTLSKLDHDCLQVPSVIPCSCSSWSIKLIVFCPTSSRSWNHRLVEQIDRIDRSSHESSWSCFPRLVATYYILLAAVSANTVLRHMECSESESSNIVNFEHNQNHGHWICPLYCSHLFDFGNLKKNNNPNHSSRDQAAHQVE